MTMTTMYAGLELRSPLIASASPLTGRLDDLLRLEDAGVGAVILPSLFEEEVEAEAVMLHERFEAVAGIGAEAAGFFPEVDLDHLGLERHLLLVQEARERLSIPVIASLNGNTPGGWTRYALDLVDAGAQAIELNTYEVVADPRITAIEVEDRHLQLIAGVRSHVDIPICVKVSPYFTAMANVATRMAQAGADALVLFNRFYQPDLDLQTLDVTPRLELSTSSELRLPLRWIAMLRPLLPNTSLGLTTGIHMGTDLAKALLAGADAAMATSELLRNGPERAAGLLTELRQWMDDHEYDSVGQLRGSVAQHTAANPSAFERSQYRQVLTSWTP